MQGENLLAANTVGNTADSDGLADTAMLTSNDSAFENLNTLARAFLNAYMNTDGIADVSFGQFFYTEDVLMEENWDGRGLSVGVKDQADRLFGLALNCLKAL